MRIRDAVETDADALATFVDVPATVMRDVVHDRTVRVAVPDEAPDTADRVPAESAPSEPAGAGDDERDGSDGAADDASDHGGDSTADDGVTTDDDATDGAGGDDAADSDAGDLATDSVAAAGPAVLGFVSFDARDGAVHVTHFGGEQAACERLLAEPVAFARREGLPVEAVVPEDEPDRVAAVEAAGFERVGTGPQFGGSPTVRFRQQP